MAFSVTAEEAAWCYWKWWMTTLGRLCRFWFKHFICFFESSGPMSCFIDWLRNHMLIKLANIVARKEVTLILNLLHLFLKSKHLLIFSSRCITGILINQLNSRPRWWGVLHQEWEWECIIQLSLQLLQIYSCVRDRKKVKLNEIDNL